MTRRLTNDSKKLPLLPTISRLAGKGFPLSQPITTSAFSCQSVKCQWRDRSSLSTFYWCLQLSMIGLDSTNRVDWELVFLLGRKAKDPIRFLRVRKLIFDQPYANWTRSFSLMCNNHKRSFVLATFSEKNWYARAYRAVRTCVPCGTHVRTVRNRCYATWCRNLFTTRELPWTRINGGRQCWR